MTKGNNENSRQKIIAMRFLISSRETISSSLSSFRQINIFQRKEMNEARDKIVASCEL